MTSIRSSEAIGIAGIPRLTLGMRPTPLQAVPELAEAMGVPVDLWVKRDDLFGPGVGGNKVRKLEYVIADALRAGCDTLITAGAVQSNHARLTAVAGATCGLDVHLVLSGEPAEASGGNLLLDKLAGASLHFVTASGFDELLREMETLADSLHEAGATPRVIPVGASVQLGAVGYADTYLELLEQLEERDVDADWVLHASGSGGTQGGLLAGRALAGRGPRVVGGIVEPMGDGTLRRRVAELYRDALLLLRAGDATRARASEDQLVASPDVLFGGEESPYGSVTAAGVAAMTAALRSCGLLLDPVYTAKALAALPSLLAAGVVESGQTVVFLHTGGTPAMFSSGLVGAIEEALC
jgi:L-cysteate sulfo-lyase